MVKVDSMGKWAGAISGGGAYSDYLGGLTFDSAGNAYMTGYVLNNSLSPNPCTTLFDTILFGSTSTYVEGPAKVFLWKIPAGTL